MNFKITKSNVFDNQVIEDLIKCNNNNKKISYLEIGVIYTKKR